MCKFWFISRAAFLKYWQKLSRKRYSGIVGSWGVQWILKTKKSAYLLIWRSLGSYPQLWWLRGAMPRKHLTKGQAPWDLRPVAWRHLRLSHRGGYPWGPTWPGWTSAWRIEMECPWSGCERRPGQRGHSDRPETGPKSGLVTNWIHVCSLWHLSVWIAEKINDSRSELSFVPSSNSLVLVSDPLKSF